MVLATYGLNSGMAVDPIQKKPLFHFYPGSRILSFGTIGCNLTCSFCQNWRISKSEEIGGLLREASPRQIAEMAKRMGCESVAFTYNDPIIFHEYAVDTAIECKKLGIKTVAVTSGYVNDAPRREFYSHMDAANVDLKAFTDDFYRKLCSARLAPVLDTLIHIKKETNVWLEITNLLIPGENDSTEELERMSAWIVENLGSDVPLHLSAFHPDFRLMDRESTPLKTLLRAREIAIKSGVRFVYTGNIRNRAGESTACPNCGNPLIERVGYQIAKNHIVNHACPECTTRLDGRF
jgi:pyruvate formate lyase activating enzyme